MKTPNMRSERKKKKKKKLTERLEELLFSHIVRKGVIIRKKVARAAKKKLKKNHSLHSIRIPCPRLLNKSHAGDHEFKGFKDLLKGVFGAYN